jgi:hypothetical protein
MNLDIFDTMDEAGLRNYIELLLWHYRVVDSFWFISVEEHFGRETAEGINDSVWTRVAPMAARDIRKRYNIQAIGLEGFVETLRLFPWTSIGGHRIEQQENEVTLTVPECPPQIARIKRGLGEYDCKDMHMNEFIRFAKEIDPKIRVKCDFAPPDPHPDHLFCKWRFYLS